MSKKVKVIVSHRSSIADATWVEPKDWEPANKIDGAKFVDGSWWNKHEEEAGIVAFDIPEELKEGDEIEVSLADLRIAYCGSCRVAKQEIVQLGD